MADTGTVEEILQRFTQVGSSADEYRAFNAWANAVFAHRPETLQELLLTLVQTGEREPRLSRYLGFLPERYWGRTIEAALEALLHGAPQSAAIEILETAIEQFPHLVHPHLPSLFTVSEACAYTSWEVPAGYFHRATHGATWDDVSFLLPYLDSENFERAQEARRWLMHSCLPQGIQAVLGGSPDEGWVFNEIGHRFEYGEYSPLYPARPLHMTFAPDYLKQIGGEPPYQSSWQPLAPPQHHLGGWSGALCNTCKGKLHHLITLDPVPPGTGVTRLTRLELAVCMTCLTNMYAEIFFFGHDVTGRPTSKTTVQLSEGEAPEFTVEPIIETAVGFADVGSRWRWQHAPFADWENQNRLGGEPIWVQRAEYPDCPDCGHIMHFLLQMDGTFPLENGQSSDYLWIEGDKGYIFWCDRCKVSAVLAQTT